MKRLELTIPTVIGVMLLIAGLGVGLWFLKEPLKSTVFASTEETPAQAQVTNITDTSFVVSWITATAATGYVQYSTSTNPDLIVSDDRDQEKGSIDNYFTHFVTIRGLKPGTGYNFRLGSGKSLYDQQGQPYHTTTGISLGSLPAADVSYGQVLTVSGEPAGGAIVYLTLAGTVPQAALVSASGSWVVPLSTARTSDLTSFAAYDLNTSQIQIQVQNSSLGIATVTTATGQDSPVPSITLGQTYNYLGPTPTPTSDTAAEPDSRFSLSALEPASEVSNALTIVSPKINEQVNSTTPEIIGRGPANSEITITIHSTSSTTDTVQTDANGEFSYSVPQDLPPGEHTITISMLIDGVVKRVQRKFTVLAAGTSQIPAFAATPAATIKPRVAMPATESGVPTSGNLTPTLVLFILGSGLIISGLVTYKKFT